MDDWRIQFQDKLAEDYTDPSGKVIPKGSEVYVACESEWKKGITISIPMPSPPALYLSLCNNLHIKANDIKSDFKFEKGLNNFKDDISIVNDYIESYFGSVVFGVTALEAFCNLNLPDNIIYNKKSNKCTESYNKDQIERWVTLDAKLREILPEVFKVNLDKSDKQWSDYKKLLEMRDRIIHLKDIDREFSVKSKSPIWHKVLIENTLNPYEISKNMMIMYYASGAPIPAWLNESP